MSAGSQIQMAPQSTVNSGQSVHSQDSNMSTGKLVLFTLMTKDKVLFNKQTKNC